MPLAVVKKLSTTTIARFKTAVLGRDFDLSVASVSRAAMQRINRTYRHKDRPTNVLAFPFSKKSGEILFCMPLIPTDVYLRYLLIHALTHLKGYDHGRIMDKLERKYCTALRIPYPTHGTKNRSRH